MALDQGTTSSRCILFDRSGTIRAVAQKEFTQYYPKPGWVEHDAQEIWDTTLEVARGAMLKNKISARDIAGIGITNQRETTIVWDKNTGEPVYNAIVWQCRRTSGMVDELVKAGLSDKIRAKTGLVPDAYFSGTKLRWILDCVPGVRERAEAGELLFRDAQVPDAAVDVVYPGAHAGPPFGGMVGRMPPRARARGGLSCPAGPGGPSRSGRR